MTLKTEQERTRRSIVSLIALSVLFYATMFLLTVFAKDIHDARLPQVSASRLSKQAFTYTVTQEDGSTMERTSKITAIPKELIDSGKVFTIRTVIENDMTFYYAVKANLTIDTSMQNEEYYAVTSLGIQSDMYILSGYENLEDGDEVFLIKDEK